ncbi:MAG: hypothetical protein KAR00_02355 [Candidatus Pacebacteria bacterium]|nr:hypothetical protein [Candidatus Paceibacterota bacterium]
MARPYEDEERIKHLKDSLYSRGFNSRSPYERSEIHKKESPAVEESWRHNELSFEKMQKKSTKKRSILKTLFWIAALFFVASVVTAVYMFYGGGIVVSSRNVDISIVGPISIPGGETLTLDIIIHNKNNVPLEAANLSVVYPTGTRMPDNLEIELLRERFDLGTIPAGSISKKTVEATLFGEKEEIKQTLLSLEYRVSGSSAVFVKEKTYDTTISLSPISIVAVYPKEVNANQEFELNVALTSNSSTVIEDLLFKVEYPFGFRFSNALPKVAYDDNIWLIGNLEPGGKRTVAIKGVMQGQNEEERTFRLDVGRARVENNKQIGISFLSTLESVFIKKPFVDLTLRTNLDDGIEYVTFLGARIPVSIEWFNTLPVNVYDATIEIKITGDVFNRNSISVQNGGFYQSVNNTIIWDRHSTPELLEVSSHDAGNVSFSLPLLQDGEGTASLRNPTVNIDAVFRGTRFSNDGAPQQVLSTASKIIKVSSNLLLGSRIVYTMGPFNNYGHLPPKAEQETTYTVFWTITNIFNDVLGATVYAKLPPYISWIGASSPLSENISFDAKNREVIWSVGNIEKGVGATLPAREVAFQLSFLPSLGQIGTIPVVVNTQTLSGKDLFTDTALEDTASPLTIWLVTDSGAVSGHERVAQ